MNKSDKVAWQWGNGLAQGEVVEIHTERTQILSKGKAVVRNGTASNPALVIKHSSGTQVLKLQSEVKKIS